MQSMLLGLPKSFDTPNLLRSLCVKDLSKVLCILTISLRLDTNNYEIMLWCLFGVNSVNPTYKGI